MTAYRTAPPIVESQPTTKAWWERAIESVLGGKPLPDEVELTAEMAKDATTRVVKRQRTAAFKAVLAKVGESVRLGWDHATYHGDVVDPDLAEQLAKLGYTVQIRDRYERPKQRESESDDAFKRRYDHWAAFVGWPCSRYSVEVKW